MATQIFFVRHGSTKSNENGIFMGTLDIMLSNKGILQAMELRGDIRERDFDVAYSSPLARAYHTATISMGFVEPLFHVDGMYTLFYLPQRSLPQQTPLHIDTRLSERYGGDLQGERREGYQERFPKYQGRGDITASFHDQPDGGENFTEVTERMKHFLDDIVEHHNGQNVLVFSHNGPIRAIRGYLDKLGERETLERQSPHCTLIPYTI